MQFLSRFQDHNQAYFEEGTTKLFQGCYTVFIFIVVVFFVVVLVIIVVDVYIGLDVVNKNLSDTHISN